MYVALDRDRSDGSTGTRVWLAPYHCPGRPKEKAWYVHRLLNRHSTVITILHSPSFLYFPLITLSGYHWVQIYIVTKIINV